MEYLLYYAIYIAVLSLVTFITYCADKQKAKTGKWRIPEKTLLIMSAIGGAIGGFIAMQAVRHKTTREHWYFTAVNIGGIILHVGIGVLIALYL